MFKIDDIVVKTDKDCWIEAGSVGIVTGVRGDFDFGEGVVVKFLTGNAKDREILCYGYNLEHSKPKNEFDSWLGDSKNSYSERELDLMKLSFYTGKYVGETK